MQLSRDSARPSVMGSPWRLLLAVLGVLCVGLAVLGVLLPGLPTTIFLIAASYLFARSCPWLEERLIRNRFFRPYLALLDSSRPMPLRVRLVALGMMWTAVGISVSVLGFASARERWTATTILLAACIGTVVLATIRRQRVHASQGSSRR